MKNCVLHSACVLPSASYLPIRIQLLLIACILALLPANAQIYSTIQGQGESLPFNTHPDTVLVDFKNDAGTLLDTALITNTSTGFYSKNILVDAVNNFSALEYSLNAYPNPFNGEINLEFQTPKTGNYILRSFDAQGKMLLEQKIFLNQGKNNFQYRGAKGLNILNIYNEEHSETKKIIQLNSENNALLNYLGNTPPENNHSNKTKSTSTTNIHITFKAKHNKDTTYIVPYAQFITQNYELSQLKESGLVNILLGAKDPVFNLQPIPGVNYAIKDANMDTLIKTGIIAPNPLLENFITEFYANKFGAPDTIWTIPNIKIEMTKNNYTPSIIILPNSLNLNAEQQLNQIAQNGNTNILINLEELPFNNPSNGANITIKNNENNQTLFTGQTNNGTLNTNLLYEYLISPNQQDTLRKINGSNITNLKYTVTKTGHTPLTIIKPFKNTNTLDTTIIQNAQQILLNYLINVKDSLYNNNLDQVNIEIKTNTNQTLTTGQTNINGDFQTNIPGFIFINPQTLDTLFTINGNLNTNFDSLVTNLNKNNYTPKTLITKIKQNTSLNETLKNIPKIIDFHMNIYNTEGLVVDSIPLIFQWKDNTQDTFTSQNGQIHIYKEDYSLTDTATIILNDPRFCKWTIGRRKHQSLYLLNLFQNVKVQSPVHPAPYTPPMDALIPIDILPDTFNLYVVDKWVINPLHVLNPVNHPDSLLAMDGIYARRALNRAGYTKKIVPIPGLDSLDYVTFTEQYTLTGQPSGIMVDTAKLNRSEYIDEQVLNLGYLPNGDTLIPPIRKYRIQNVQSQDPKWQQVVARNYDGLIYTYYKIGTPGNSGGPGIPYYNNPSVLRIKYVYSFFNQSSADNDVFEEKFEAFFWTQDPDGSSSGPFIYSTQNNGVPTPFAKKIAGIMMLFDIGTEYY